MADKDGRRARKAQGRTLLKEEEEGRKGRKEGCCPTSVMAEELGREEKGKERGKGLRLLAQW